MKTKRAKTARPDVVEFAARVHEYIARMRDEDMPMVLSVDGKPALVVYDIRLHEFLAKTDERHLAELLDSRVKAIDSGEEQCIPAEQFFRELREEIRSRNGSKRRGARGAGGGAKRRATGGAKSRP